MPLPGLGVEPAGLAEHRLDRRPLEGLRDPPGIDRLLEDAERLAKGGERVVDVLGRMGVAEVVDAGPQDPAPDQLLLHQGLHDERIAGTRIAPGVSKLTSVRNGYPVTET